MLRLVKIRHLYGFPSLDWNGRKSSLTSRSIYMQVVYDAVMQEKLNRCCNTRLPCAYSTPNVFVSSALVKSAAVLYCTSIFWCATGPFSGLFLNLFLLSVFLPPSLPCFSLSPSPNSLSVCACAVLFLFLSLSLATLEKIKKNSLPFLLSVSSLSSVFSHRFHLFLLTSISA